MIDVNTFNFLKDLKQNNSKEWLDDNRKMYENAKNNILALTSELITAVSSTDHTISSAILDPKKCITRLNRDLRFTKDKTPYKTDYYIILNKNGKNSSSAFYYLHVEPDNCFVGGGVYNPLPEHLKKIRSEINYFFEEWKDIIDSKFFKKTFPSGIHNSGVLSKIPKEFNEPNQAGEFLKMKGFYTMKKITDNQMISNATFEKIKIYLNTSKPLVDFLNRAIQNE